MYYEGTDLKFRVSAKIEGFSMDDHDCKVVIKNSWGNILKDEQGNEYILTKDNMFQDSEGMWYFVIENIKKGHTTPSSMLPYPMMTITSRRG